MFLWLIVIGLIQFSMNARAGELLEEEEKILVGAIYSSKDEFEM